MRHGKSASCSTSEVEDEGNFILKESNIMKASRIRMKNIPLNDGSTSIGSTRFEMICKTTHKAHRVGACILTLISTVFWISAFRRVFQFRMRTCTCFCNSLNLTPYYLQAKESVEAYQLKERRRSYTHNLSNGPQALLVTKYRKLHARHILLFLLPRVAFALRSIPRIMPKPVGEYSCPAG